MLIIRSPIFPDYVAYQGKKSATGKTFAEAITNLVKKIKN